MIRTTTCSFLYLPLHIALFECIMQHAARAGPYQMIDNHATPGDWPSSAWSVGSILSKGYFPPQKSGAVDKNRPSRRSTWACSSQGTPSVLVFDDSLSADTFVPVACTEILYRPLAGGGHRDITSRRVISLRYLRQGMAMVRQRDMLILSVGPWCCLSLQSIALLRSRGAWAPRERGCMVAVKQGEAGIAGGSARRRARCSASDEA